MSHPEITFRYFDVRGRGQFIRALLAARDVPFKDDRVILNEDLSSWRARDRNDREISGPFQKVPNLQWGDTRIGEVLVIVDFLHRRLGDAARLGEERSLRHQMLASSAFLDLLTPVINLIWSDIFQPGTDVPKTAAGVKARLGLHLATLEQTLADWRWLDELNERPVMAADAVLWEALDVIRETFQGDVGFDQHPNLVSFYAQCPGQETFRRLLEERPATITARPGEPAALAAIRG